MYRHDYEPIRSSDEVADLSRCQLVNVTEAGKLLSCSKSKVYTLLAAGLLERRKLGNATRITLNSIRKIAGG